MGTQVCPHFGNLRSIKHASKWELNRLVWSSLWVGQMERLPEKSCLNAQAQLMSFQNNKHQGAYTNMATNCSSMSQHDKPLIKLTLEHWERFLIYRQKHHQHGRNVTHSCAHSTPMLRIPTAISSQGARRPGSTSKRSSDCKAVCFWVEKEYRSTQNPPWLAGTTGLSSFSLLPNQGVLGELT